MPGAGRPAGSATVKTREVRDRLAADGGITPLEVMVTAMREVFEESRLVVGADRIALLGIAVEHAVKAAQWFHPKPAPVKSTEDGEEQRAGPTTPYRDWWREEVNRQREEYDRLTHRADNASMGDDPAS